jgi:hypothetical protein
MILDNIKDLESVSTLAHLAYKLKFSPMLRMMFGERFSAVLRRGPLSDEEMV